MLQTIINPDGSNFTPETNDLAFTFTPEVLATQNAIAAQAAQMPFESRDRIAHTIIFSGGYAKYFGNVEGAKQFLSLYLMIEPTTANSDRLKEIESLRTWIDTDPVAQTSFSLESPTAQESDIEPTLAYMDEVMQQLSSPESKYYEDCMGACVDLFQRLGSIRDRGKFRMEYPGYPEDVKHFELWGDAHTVFERTHRTFLWADLHVRDEYFKYAHKVVDAVVNKLKSRGLFPDSWTEKVYEEDNKWAIGAVRMIEDLNRELDTERYYGQYNEKLPHFDELTKIYNDLYANDSYRYRQEWRNVMNDGRNAKITSLRKATNLTSAHRIEFLSTPEERLKRLELKERLLTTGELLAPLRTDAVIPETQSAIEKRLPAFSQVFTFLVEEIKAGKIKAENFGQVILCLPGIRQLVYKIGKDGLNSFANLDTSFDPALGMSEELLNFIALGSKGIGNERLSASVLHEAIMNAFELRTLSLLYKLQEIKRNHLSELSETLGIELDSESYRLPYDSDRATLNGLYAKLQDLGVPVFNINDALSGKRKTQIEAEVSGDNDLLESTSSTEIKALLNTVIEFIKFKTFNKENTDIRLLVDRDQNDFEIQCDTAAKIITQISRLLLDRFDGEMSGKTSHAYVATVLKHRIGAAYGADSNHSLTFFGLSAPFQGYEFGIIDYNHSGIILIPKEAIVVEEPKAKLKYPELKGDKTVKVRIDPSLVKIYKDGSLQDADGVTPELIQLHLDKDNFQRVSDYVIADELCNVEENALANEIVPFDERKNVFLIGQYANVNLGVLNNRAEVPKRVAMLLDILVMDHFGYIEHVSSGNAVMNTSNSYLYEQLIKIYYVAETAKNWPAMYAVARETNKLKRYVEADAVPEDNFFNDSWKTTMLDLKAKELQAFANSADELEKFYKELTTYYADAITVDEAKNIYLYLQKRINEAIEVDETSIQIDSQSFNKVRDANRAERDALADKPGNQVKRNMKFEAIGLLPTDPEVIDHQIQLSTAAVLGPLTNFFVLPESLIAQLNVAIGSSSVALQDSITRRSDQWTVIMEEIKMLAQIGQIYGNKTSSNRRQDPVMLPIQIERR